MRSNLPTEKKLNTLVKKSVDLNPLQILGWKGIKSKNTAILTLKYPSWEQKVRRPRVKKSGDKKSGKTSNLQGELVFVQKWGRRTFSMEIGWFWGEIRVLWWRQLINTAVGHYLWGIDTCNCSSEIIKCCKFAAVGHYLWGIDTDTQFSTANIFAVETVGHYLWGIDTYIELRMLFVCCFIKSVGHYLWGIDTFLTGIYPMDISSSDITYEELIPSGRRESLPIHEPSGRSDITYEELIQYAVAAVRSSKAASVGHYLWGIDTIVSNFFNVKQLTSDITYEELIRYKALHGKHICRRYLLKSDITYEELIRNRIKNKFCYRQVGHYLWGIDTKSWTVLDTSRFKFIVGHYLWGIDTVLNCIFWGQWSLVGHYLWGIDTLFLLRHGL